METTQILTLLDTSIPTSAGLALIYDNKILIGHPTNNPLHVACYSIPKGTVEKGETYLDAAIRETREEVGITIPKELINSEPRVVFYKWREGGQVKKQVVYFYVHLNELPKECDKHGVVKTKHLQLAEIDYAKFATRQDAKALLFWKQIPILNILNL